MTQVDQSWVLFEQQAFNATVYNTVVEIPARLNLKDPPGGTTFDFKRVDFLTLFQTRFFCTGGPKLDPQQVETGASLKVRF